MAASTNIIANDSPIMAKVTLRDEHKVKSEIFIQPYSRAEVSKNFSIDPITYNQHPRIKVL